MLFFFHSKSAHKFSECTSCGFIWMLYLEAEALCGLLYGSQYCISKSFLLFWRLYAAYGWLYTALYLASHRKNINEIFQLKPFCYNNVERRVLLSPENIHTELFEYGCYCVLILRHCSRERKLLTNLFFLLYNHFLN